MKTASEIKALADKAKRDESAMTQKEGERTGVVKSLEVLKTEIKALEFIPKETAEAFSAFIDAVILNGERPDINPLKELYGKLSEKIDEDYLKAENALKGISEAF